MALPLPCALSKECILLQNYSYNRFMTQSQEMLDRIFQRKANTTFYDHHNMPARQSYRALNKSSSGWKQQARPQSQQTSDNGRDLYPFILKQKEDPGPGSYDSPSSKCKSFKFVGKATLPRKVKPRKNRNDLIGPGYYNYEETISNALLSRTRKPLGSKFSTDLKQQRLAFSIAKTPGPGNYNYQHQLNRVSNHSEICSHKISTTLRSSIIRSDSLPGPGYYNWDKFYQKERQKKKPVIEYKFVYGHPS